MLPKRTSRGGGGKAAFATSLCQSPISIACLVQYLSRCHDAEFYRSQLAAKMVLNAAERGGIVTLAEIAVRRALHGKPEPPQEPRRKRAKAYKVVH